MLVKNTSNGVKVSIKKKNKEVKTGTQMPRASA
jgi:hypothetical protein